MPAIELLKVLFPTPVIYVGESFYPITIVNPRITRIPFQNPGANRSL